MMGTPEDWLAEADLDALVDAGEIIPIADSRWPT